MECVKKVACGTDSSDEPSEGRLVINKRGVINKKGKTHLVDAWRLIKRTPLPRELRLALEFEESFFFF